MNSPVLKLMLIVVLSVGAVAAQAQTDTTKAPKIRTITDVSEELQTLAKSIKEKFKAQNNQQINDLLNEIKQSKKIIGKSGKNELNADYINAVDQDVAALNDAYESDDFQEAEQIIADVSEDLKIKAAAKSEKPEKHQADSSKTDSVKDDGPLMFQKITFKVQPCRQEGANCVELTNCKIRANCWALRKKPDPLHNFDDTRANPPLEVSLVRGTYGFWVVTDNSETAPPLRKYIKITVDTAHRNKTILLQIN